MNVQSIARRYQNLLPNHIVLSSTKSALVSFSAQALIQSFGSGGFSFQQSTTVATIGFVTALTYLVVSPIFQTLSEKAFGFSFGKMSGKSLNSLDHQVITFQSCAGFIVATLIKNIADKLLDKAHAPVALMSVVASVCSQFLFDNSAHTTTLCIIKMN